MKTGERERGLELRGARVVLRSPRAGDEREFVELRRASRAFLAPWEASGADHDPFGPERFQRFLARRRSSQRFVLRRCQDGALVGALSLTRIELVARSAQVGFWVGAEHTRRGYMSEALGLVERWAALERGLARLEAQVLPDNSASLALLEKLGYRRDSTATPLVRAVAGREREHELWLRELPQP
jgi:ribosomal-protein-alanine N-acetyltransferase